MTPRGLVTLTDGAIERDDPPAPTVAFMAEALVNATMSAWRLAISNSSPGGQGAPAWMEDVRLGDLVVVNTWSSEPPINRVGIYHCAWSWLGERDGWDDEPLRCYDVHQIQKLDGDYLTWSNAQILRVPQGYDWTLRG